MVVYLYFKKWGGKLIKELKQIELDDLKELQNMLKDFWTSQLVEASNADILEDIRRLLNPKCFSYLIMCDGSIAGFIYVNEKYGYNNNIEYLYVKKDFRGKGLGSFALDEIKRILFENNYDRVQIEVNPSNKEALKLYHSLGFDNIDTITLSTGIVGETEVVTILGENFKINKRSLFSYKKKESSK